MAVVWAWCRKRSKIVPTVGTSPRSLPHSSSGRLRVILVDRFSYRRMITSKRAMALHLSLAIILFDWKMFSERLICLDNGGACFVGCLFLASGSTTTYATIEVIGNRAVRPP